MKITIGRIFDASRTLATEAGEQLKEFVDYTALMSEQVLRSLRNGLTFQDNFNCDVRTVSLTHDTPQVISVRSNSVYGVIPLRVVSRDTGVDNFAWYFNEAGQLEVKIGLTGAPSEAQSITILILFV